MNTYAEELGEVLRTFDIHKMRIFVLDHIDIYRKNLNFDNMIDDDFVKGMMAKMIIARTDMPEDLKQRARNVLDKMGWDYTV